MAAIKQVNSREELSKNDRNISMFVFGSAMFVHGMCDTNQLVDREIFKADFLCQNSQEVN